MIVSFNLNEIVSSKLNVISANTGISVDELLSRICSELVDIVSDVEQINVSSALAILPEALEDQIIASMEGDQLADLLEQPEPARQVLIDNFVNNIQVISAGFREQVLSLFTTGTSDILAAEIRRALERNKAQPVESEEAAERRHLEQQMLEQMVLFITEQDEPVTYKQISDYIGENFENPVIPAMRFTALLNEGEGIVTRVEVIKSDRKGQPNLYGVNRFTEMAEAGVTITVEDDVDE